MFPFHHSSDGNLKPSPNLCSLFSFPASRATSKPELSPSETLAYFLLPFLLLESAPDSFGFCAAGTLATDLHIQARLAAVADQLFFCGEPGRCVRSIGSGDGTAVAEFQVREGMKVPPARLVESLAHFLI